MNAYKLFAMWMVTMVKLHKWIDLAGADYLTDNDDILVIFVWTDVIAEGYWTVKSSSSLS